ncbi:MAG: cell cycle histidine kinase CckA [Aestuariivirgaceae bacterium]
MSDAGLAQTPPANQDSDGQRQGRPILAVVLAIVLAGLVGVIALRLHGQWATALLVVLGVAAFAGLMTLFGALAGFVHFGRLPKQMAFFDGLMDAVGDGCVVTDGRGRVIYTNKSYRELINDTGATRVIGVENLYTGFPDVSERVYRLAQRAREGVPATEEFRLNEGSTAAGAHPDRPSWLRVSVSPVSTPLGQNFTLWQVSDITTDRSRQESAFANLQYIINYLDHAPAGFFSTTAEGEIAYLNATLADWLEIDLPQTTDGKLKIDDLLPAESRSLLMGIAPQPGESRTELFDLDLKSRSGKTFPTRIMHRVDYDYNGKLQPSRSLVLDRRASQSGAEGGEVFQMQMARLINDAPIGIAQINSDGVIENVNPAFVEISPAAIRGVAISDVVQEDQREDVKSQLAALIKTGGKAKPLSVTFVGDDSNKGQMEFSIADAGNDNTSNITVFAADTTKHQSLEEQIKQGQKMQAVGQLAGGVAHDFNNVLTAIIGFSDLLLTKHRPTDPAFADIMNIKQNANRAANLVRQLLAFSRRQTLRPEVLSMTDVLSDLGNLLGRLLGEKVELQVVHGRDLGPVKVDVNQFEQVVINLAVNARDAMPDGGVLTVRTANVSRAESAKVNPGLMPEGEYVLCQVSDTGTGMPPEVVEKIYEPFFSTKEVGKGTGLGLSTVYGIIKQTGGFVFCDSELGKGTTFSIYLPRHAETAEEAEEAKQAETQVEAREDYTGQGTILLVEDEDAVRSFASRALASRGYTVLEADSGETALELAKEHDGEFDLVLSDVVMPEMDGPTLLKELRAHGINTKVVFISGYAEDAFEKNLEGQEDFAFLPKPFSLKQLAGAVKDAMASQS